MSSQHLLAGGVGLLAGFDEYYEKNRIAMEKFFDAGMVLLRVTADVIDPDSRP